MYLSDSAKQHIKNILKRAEELGHLPSFSEFSSDPKITNAMASCFGSYSEAVATAKLFYNNPDRRQELEPKPPTPPPEPKGSRKRRSSGKKRSYKELIESASKSSITPIVTPKTTQTASEPAESPKEPETSESPTSAEEAPETPPEAPEPQEIVEEASPEGPRQDSPTEPEEMAIQPVSEPIKEVTQMSKEQTIINLMPKEAKLVDEVQYYQALSSKEADVTPVERGGIATIMKTELPVDSFIYESDDDLHEVPIVSVYGRPALIKDGAVYEFPSQKDSVLLLVEREVAESAREIGRDTDDLIFPLESTIIGSKVIYCKKLGKL